MNIFYLEEQLNKLRNKSSSLAYRVYGYYSIFQDILLAQNKLILSAYACPLLQDYLVVLKTLSPECYNPNVITILIKQLTAISKLPEIVEIKAELQTIIFKLEPFQFFPNSLTLFPIRSKHCFPLLQDKDGNPEWNFSALETCTIKISKSKEKDSFIIIPSETEIEKQISSQIITAWENALVYISSYLKKISSHHEVLINFDEKHGFYKGESLGAALAISFIEALLIFYNAPYHIKIIQGTAITGGLTSLGKLLPVSDEIIKRKVEAVYFSSVKHFVIHFSDLPGASDKLISIRKEFPGKNLKLSGIQSLEEIFDRRDIVEINKISIIKRCLIFIKKRWMYALIQFLIVFLLIIFGLIDFDKNPFTFENHGNLLLVKNKNGRILWERRVDYNLDLPQWSHKIVQRIVDLDGDGENEVLLCEDSLGLEVSDGRLLCLNSNGNKKWEYNFKDKISNSQGEISNTYQINLIDVIDVGGEKIIYAFARHNPYSTSAVFSLEGKTGRRINGVLWHPGHLHAGLIGDFNRDNKKEIVMLGINNGFETSVIFSIDLVKLNGQAPAIPASKFLGYPIADFNKYVLLPKTDYNDYLKLRLNHPHMGGLNYHVATGEFIFPIAEGLNLAGLHYTCNSDLTKIEPGITDAFQVIRDSLVVNGAIKGPLTTSPEYDSLLKSKLRVWNGNGFIHPENF